MPDEDAPTKPIREMTPYEVDLLVAHVKAPLEGFKQAIVAARTARDLSDEQFDLARRCRFVRGNSEHPAFMSFDVDEKGRIEAEGEARRKWYNTHVGNVRSLLKFASAQDTKAAYFQGLLGEVVRAEATIARAEEDEEDEEDRAESRRDRELAERLMHAAGESEPSKREKNGVKRQAKMGKEATQRRLERLKELEAKAEEAM